MKKIGWPGHGWKYSCQRCGFWYPSTEIKAEWTGLHVCGKCFETRHPQTLIKVHGEKAFPTYISKDGTDTFVGSTCDIASSSGYVGLGAAGCLQVGNSSIAYSVLYDLFKNGHGDL